MEHPQRSHKERLDRKSRQTHAHQGSNREKDKVMEVKGSDWSPLNLFNALAQQTKGPRSAPKERPRSARKERTQGAPKERTQGAPHRAPKERPKERLRSAHKERPKERPRSTRKERTQGAHPRSARKERTQG